MAGVQADTPATVLCDGDAGLWRLQCEALPGATVVLDWWHAAVRFEHALQAARSLGADPADTHLTGKAVRGLERAKWRLWHGHWAGCRRKLATPCRWTERKPLREVAGIGRFQQRASELLGYLIAKRMNKKQQMRWNRATVQPFLDVRLAVLNDTLEDAFRYRRPGFRPANDDHKATAAAA